MMEGCEMQFTLASLDFEPKGCYFSFESNLDTEGDIENIDCMVKSCTG